MNRRVTAIPLAFGLLLSPAVAEEKQGRGKGTANTRPAAPRTAAPKSGTQRETGAQPGKQIDRLRNMSPEEREKVLSRVPAERRQNIERRLGELQKLPPATVDRIRTRQELLNSFPPPRQNQIKKSVQQFLNLPEERRDALNRELQKMAPLPDDERRAYMNTEEFRNRFTASEQQMMGNLIAITPASP